MILQEFKRMLRAATATVDPLSFAMVLGIFALIEIVVVASHFQLHTHIQHMALSLAAFLFCWFAVISSGLVLQLSAKPLRLPVTPLARLVTRTCVLFVLFFCAPTILATACTGSDSWWVAAIFICSSAAITMWMLLPALPAMGLVFTLIGLSFATYNLAFKLQLATTDPHSALHLIAIAMMFYAIAWFRWKKIKSKEVFDTSFHACLIEKITAQQNSDRRPLDFAAKTPSALMSLITNPTGQSAAEKMRAFLGFDFLRYRWLIRALAWSAVFVLLIAIVKVLAVLNIITAPHIHTANRMVMSLCSALLIFQNTHEKRVAALLRTQSHNLAEMALLPSFNNATDAFCLLRNAITMPVLKFATLVTFVSSIAALLFSSIPTTMVVVFVLSGLCGSLFQLLRILQSFSHGQRRFLRHSVSIILIFSWFLPQIVTCIFLQQFLIDVVEDGRSITSQSILIGMMFSILLTSLALGYRWYRQLKALPHPFVEISE